MIFSSALCFVLVLSLTLASKESQAEVDKLMDQISSEAANEMAKIAEAGQQDPKASTLELNNKLLETLRDHLKKMEPQLKVLGSLTNDSAELISKNLTSRIKQNEKLRKALLTNGKLKPRCIGALYSGIKLLVSGVTSSIIPSAPKPSSVFSGSSLLVNSLVAGSKLLGNSVVAGSKLLGNSVVAGAKLLGNSVVGGSNPKGNPVPTCSESPKNSVSACSNLLGNSVLGGGSNLLGNSVVGGGSNLLGNSVVGGGSNLLGNSVVGGGSNLLGNSVLGGGSNYVSACSDTSVKSVPDCSRNSVVADSKPRGNSVSACSDQRGNSAQLCGWYCKCK